MAEVENSRDETILRETGIECRADCLSTWFSIIYWYSSTVDVLRIFGNMNTEGDK